MVRKDWIGRSGFKILMAMILVSGMTLVLISPATADVPSNAGQKPVVTITALGSQKYYLGEKVFLSGRNTDSDSTYLFMTGPNIPDGGASLTSPRLGVVSGWPETFTIVKTRPDNTWDYSYYTANLPLDAGSYTLFAVSKPFAKPQISDSTTYGTVSIILKRPFISAEISPKSLVQGQPFTITGAAEGLPPAVQIWIIGKNYAFTTKAPVDQNASFTLSAGGAMTGPLPDGQNYLIVQHPMQNNTFDVVKAGDYVQTTKINNGTTLFRISGPGSLQGSDAADALIAAFDIPSGYDTDTYTVIPFQVAMLDTSGLQAQTSQASVVQTTARKSPLGFAPAGAIFLIIGILIWRRR